MRTARQISKLAKARRNKPLSDDFIDDREFMDDDCDTDRYQYNQDRVDKQFFIDRDGVIRKYSGDLKVDIISMHYHIAADLFPGIDYPDDHVCVVLGWILCGSTVYNTPICYRKPTAAQLKALQDLGDWYIKYLCFEYKGSMIKYSQYSALCNDL